mmetsp:Transcript_120149/g.340045  ORF Transcript_120149/g.340045 Transcript_120149/m.340045 type:complete len:208 (+) Transcript_120149:36-659(+)
MPRRKGPTAIHSRDSITLIQGNGGAWAARRAASTSLGGTSKCADVDPAAADESPQVAPPSSPKVCSPRRQRAPRMCTSPSRDCGKRQRRLVVQQQAWTCAPRQRKPERNHQAATAVASSAPRPVAQTKAWDPHRPLRRRAMRTMSLGRAVRAEYATARRRGKLASSCVHGVARPWRRSQPIAASTKRRAFLACQRHCGRCWATRGGG